MKTNDARITTRPTQLFLQTVRLNLISEQNIIVIEVADEVYDNFNFDSACKRFETTRNYFGPQEVMLAIDFNCVLRGKPAQLEHQDQLLNHQSSLWIISEQREP